MGPGAGLGQAAKAVERAMAALAKAEGEKGSGKQGAKQEVGVLVGLAGVGDRSSGRCLCTAYQNIQAAELRKWREKAELMTQHLKARDAEVRLRPFGLRRLDVMVGKIKRHLLHVLPHWTFHATIPTQLLAAEAKAEALEETGKQAINRVQALEGELQQQVGWWSEFSRRLWLIPLYSTSHSYRHISPRPHPSHFNDKPR